MSLRMDRSRILAYRLAAHGLNRPLGPVADVPVLSTGIQDAPPGRTAPLALAVRAGALTTAGVADLVADGTLALAYTIRGAMHVHAGRDLGRLMAAMRVDDGNSLAVSNSGPFAAELEADGIGFGSALEGVAAAMADVMADGQARTKGELSEAITPAVNPRLAPWCAGCGVQHVQDAMFRYATLPAGLRLVYDRSPPAVKLVRATGVRQPSAAKSPSTADSRADLVREFLRLCGPATPTLLAIWLALTPAAAKAWWPATALVQIDVDGARRWMHRDDVGVVPDGSAIDGVRLLPPYDPWLELADRELLVPDKARRREVWRAAQNPGVLLVDGEIAGVWRHKTSAPTVAVTVRPFGTLTTAHRAAIEESAEELARVAGGSGVAVRIEAT